MHPKPEKVTKEYVANAWRDGETLDKNDFVKVVLNLLFQVKAFGYGTTSKRTLSRIMYEFSPPENQNKENTTKKIPENKLPKLETWGHGRIQNVCDGNKPCTHREAKFLYYYFIKSFGNHWRTVISIEQLVTLPLIENFTRGLDKGLAWPANIPSFYQLHHILNQNSHSLRQDFKIKWSKAKSKLGSSSSGKQVKFSKALQCPEHFPGDLLEIEVKGIPTKQRQLIIFETLDEAIFQHNDGDICTTAFEIYLHRHIRANMSKVRLSHSDKSLFTMLEPTGIFCLYALAIPGNWDFKEKFGFEPKEATAWPREESEKFINHLQLLLPNDDVSVAAYTYRVP